MTAQELAQMLREAGVDETHVAGLVNNAAFQAKAQGLARQTELATIQQRAQELETSYTKSKTYEDWYNKYFPAINEQNALIAAYEERYGAINGNRTQPNNTTTTQNQPVQKPMTQAEIDAMIDQRMQTKWGGEVTNTIMDTGKLVEAHMRNKRTNAIDWTEIRKLATENGGNLQAAYDKWDEPERVKQTEAEYKVRLDADVQKELDKRMQAMGGSMFPAGAGADYGSGAPSPLRPRTGEEVPAYDRNKVIEAANSVLRDPGYKPGFGRIN